MKKENFLQIIELNVIAAICLKLGENWILHLVNDLNDTKKLVLEKITQAKAG